MQHDRRCISPAPGAGVQPREGLLHSLSFAVLFTAADVCSDMTRQVAGRVSSACAAGDTASSVQALLPVPVSSVPPEMHRVGENSRTRGGSGSPCRVERNRQGENSAADAGSLGLSHSSDLGPFVKFPCAWRMPACPFIEGTAQDPVAVRLMFIVSIMSVQGVNKADTL